MIGTRTCRWVTYIAGPMKGYEDFNFAAFFSAEKTLSAMGWEVVNPARMDKESPLPNEEAWRYVERDILALVQIARDTVKGRGAVHFLPGWHLSTGALAEWAVARWLGLERIYL